MEVKDKYIRQFWPEIAMAQVEDEYRARGYRVEREKRIDAFWADLYAEKGDDKIIFEFSFSKMDIERFRHIQQFANSHGMRYQYVVTNYSPLKNQIVMDGLEEMLFDYIISEGGCEVGDLGNHQDIEGVADVEVQRIEVGDGDIQVEGCATTSVTVYLDHEEEVPVALDLPTTFQLTLRWNGKVWQVDDSCHQNEVKIDTDPFYE